MNRWLVLAALLVAGCAQSPALSDTGSAGHSSAGPILATNSTGNATAEIIWPCPQQGVWVPDFLKTNLNILVDGKAVGTIKTCQHTSVSLAAGSRSIRLGDPLVDFGAFSGNGDVFQVPAGGTLHLLASPDGNTHLVIHEVSSNRARMEIAEIDTH
ncbi:hypothetical protein [Hyphomicrobium sp.]|uniref:hypothetical protein n=1 Tax=Hyphomicrobium sp. TaxID=82 RepID=UPI001DB7D1D6|nr:hypothetical protein [Hyphomicrobium sp.]MBY0562343.1 hypothetical protein [Hyphomicrobium sp.]